jgi:hypothetical protein
LNLPAPGDSLQNFKSQLGSNLYRCMRPPKNSDNGDTCYHYTELIKVEINKSSKIVSIELSDSAPNWMKEDIGLQKKNKCINRGLDSIALASKWRNCSLVFPVVIESEDFPCGAAPQSRRYEENYFHFSGYNLRGNIIFGEPIKLIYSTRYIHKTGQ